MSFVKDDISELLDGINMVRAAKSNPNIKYMRDVIKGRGNKEEAVISGISILEHVLSSDIKIKTLIICPEEVYSERAVNCVIEGSKKAQTTLEVSKGTFELVGAKKNSNGIAALIELDFMKIEDISAQGINIVMDSLELPGNIGTIMRTADGAGLNSVIITNNKARINNPTLLSASRGAFSRLKIVVDDVDNIAAWAAENDVTIFLADTRAEYTHTKANLSLKSMFVVGCERYGIDKKWYEKELELIKIPMLGICDSLNVGVAGSILIYEALRQQKD
jgi:TrmH family RNA methyltransferase